MSKLSRIALLLSAMLCVCLYGCNYPSPTPEDDVSAQEEPQATATITMQPVADEPLATAVHPTATIEHVVIPGAPANRHSFLDDVDSAASANQGGVTFGDSFQSGRYERPFSAGTMEYKPELDITSAELSFDDEFYYFAVHLEGGFLEDSIENTYALEFDLDRDGRGDLLISGDTPLADRWQVEGVRVWQDENVDVGGMTAMRADPPDALGDGYEVLMFDQGYGEDPDSAWARSPSNNLVQFAVKRDVFEATAGFLWSAWSYGGVLDPASFDHNDRMTKADAGSPVLGDPEYPLVQLALLDNTCRMYFGFTPTGTEPGICALPSTATPEPTVTPSATATLNTGIIAGLVWIDLDVDGVKDGGETPLDGHLVQIRDGACPGSSRHWNIHTGYIEYGTNYLLQLSPGTYCVTTDYETQSTTGGEQQTVDLPPGGQVRVNFGFREPPS